MQQTILEILLVSEDLQSFFAKFLLKVILSFTRLLPAIFGWFTSFSPLTAYI